MYLRERHRTKHYVIEENTCVDRDFCDPGCTHRWFAVNEIRGEFGNIEHTFSTCEEALLFAREKYGL